MPIADSQSITFSARTRIYLGEYGGPLSHVGLLGGPCPLSLNIQYRGKRDQYPQRNVTTAIKSIDATFSLRLEEWSPQNLTWALGLWDVDTTTIPGVDQLVTTSVVFNNAGLAVLPHPVKVGTGVLVTGFTSGVDFHLIPRDQEGRSFLYHLNPLMQSVQCTYTRHIPDYTQMVIGGRDTRFFTVRLEEPSTSGNTTTLILHKCQLQIQQLSLGAAEGKHIPITVRSVYDTNENRLCTLQECDSMPATTRISLTVSNMSVGEQRTVDITGTLGRIGRIYWAASSAPARLRFYGTTADRTADQMRQITTRPDEALSVWADMLFVSGTLQFPIADPPDYANMENPKQPIQYLLVENQSGIQQTITVTLEVLIIYA